MVLEHVGSTEDLRLGRYPDRSVLAPLPSSGKRDTGASVNRFLQIVDLGATSQSYVAIHYPEGGDF